MIHRIDSTFQSLQGVQAARSFQAAQKASVFRQALEQELEDVQPQSMPPEPQPRLRDALPPAQPQAVSQRQPLPQRPVVSPQLQLEPMIQEVRQIAEASGFIGVSNQDIMRAYKTGQSFLADYRV